jgi:hypothetical protein
LQAFAARKRDLSDKNPSQVLISAPPSMPISSAQTTALGRQPHVPEIFLQVAEDTYFLLRANWLI